MNDQEEFTKTSQVVLRFPRGRPVVSPMTSRLLSTAFFVSGIWAWRHPWPRLPILFVAVLVVSLWNFEPLNSRVSRWFLLMALAVGLGRAGIDTEIWRLHSVLEPHTTLTVNGTVSESPRLWGKATVFILSVDSLDGRPLNAPLRLLVRWSNCEEAIEPGERWRVTGKFHAGEEAEYPGGFSQGFWLWTQRVRGTLQCGRFSEISYIGPPAGWSPQALAYRLRHQMLRRLQKIENGDARALVVGVVFGETQSLPKELQEQFRRTGTSHLLAASGMNVALLAGIILGGARLLGFGPWRVAPLAAPLVILYALLAGSAPSIVRATAGALMTLLALWLGRKSHAWNSLALSIWILLLWEPRQLYDLGFQLSVLAVIGLIAGPSLPPKTASWKKNALLTVSATLVTLPIMWWTFHELSLTILLSNLILGPLVESLFPLGLLVALAPLSPLLWVVERLAQTCLFLVGVLSSLADPIHLAKPTASVLATLALAVLVWLFPFEPRNKRWCWIGLPLAALSLVFGYKIDTGPRLARGEIVIRRVDSRKPLFWISSEQEEVLVLSGPWQEKRARTMLLDMGCRRTPQIKVLASNETFDIQWGAFRWRKVQPLLEKNPFTEVRTAGTTYAVKYWRPEREY